MARKDTKSGADGHASGEESSSSAAPPPPRFCQRLTAEQYEAQSRAATEKALADLAKLLAQQDGGASDQKPLASKPSKRRFKLNPFKRRGKEKKKARKHGKRSQAMSGTFGAQSSTSATSGAGERSMDEGGASDGGSMRPVSQAPAAADDTPSEVMLLREQVAKLSEKVQQLETTASPSKGAPIRRRRSVKRRKRVVRRSRSRSRSRRRRRSTSEQDQSEMSQSGFESSTAAHEPTPVASPAPATPVSQAIAATGATVVISAGSGRRPSPAVAMANLPPPPPPIALAVSMAPLPPPPPPLTAAPTALPAAPVAAAAAAAANAVPSPSPAPPPPPPPPPPPAQAASTPKRGAFASFSFPARSGDRRSATPRAAPSPSRHARGFSFDELLSQSPKTLRKTNRPRSPGGTPISESGHRRTASHPLHEALQKRFENVSHRSDSDSDDDDSSSWGDAANESLCFGQSKGTDEDTENTLPKAPKAEEEGDNAKPLLFREAVDGPVRSPLGVTN